MQWKAAVPSADRKVYYTVSLDYICLRNTEGKTERFVVDLRRAIDAVLAGEEYANGLLTILQDQATKAVVVDPEGGQKVYLSYSDFVRCLNDYEEPIEE